MKPALDFSILDEKERATAPADAPHGTGQYKTTCNIQDSSQTSLASLQGIQQLKIDISQGIKAAADPYPLLLEAIQAIATATNDREFYTMHRDAMQGMGMLEQIPTEWVQECDTGDEYDKRIKRCFAAAYRFLDENKHARTDADWERITGSISSYKDPLMIGLVVECINELEREYEAEKTI